MTSDQRRVAAYAIVGGGCSGTLLAATLLREARAPVRVLLIEPRPEPGRGVAYGTSRVEHLLNVPAGRMSALPEDPGHFLRWARESGRRPDAQAGDFLPRRMYGTYLGDVLREAAAATPAGSTVEHVASEAVDLRPRPRGATLVLSDGRRIEAERVALALGNPSPRRSPVRGESTVPFVDDPWEAGALDSLPSRGTVLVLGAGLTMVDVVLAMDAAGHRGTVHAVSRRGFLPRTHATSPLASTVPPAPTAPTALAWLRAFRAEVAAGADARAVVDALRPTTAAAWRSLPERERERFLRHVRPLWDALRHRTAPSVGSAMERRILDGRLVVHRGRIVALAKGPHGARAEIRLRWGGGTRFVDPVAIVNATGPEGDPAADPRPLVRSLLRSGLARCHPLGLGFDANPDGDLVGADGVASGLVATLGPPLRGVLWESTAVPEIRAQASALARRWLSRVPG